MTNKEALQKAVESVGGQTRLATLLNELQDKPSACRPVKQQHVYNWLQSGLPAHWVVPVSRVTGIAAHELSPELYPKDAA